MEKFINDEIPSRWSTFRINLYATLSRLSENKEEKKVKIMKKKLSIGLFISLLIPILSSALTVNEGNAKISDSTSIAIIFSTGGLGDKAFNDAAYQGLVQANTTYSGQFNYTYVLPDNEDEVESYQQSLASAGHDLIICVGWIQATALEQTALMYPNQRFTIIDGIVSRSNVSSITFKEQEGSYLVGAMAGMTTQTDKVGFFGGMNIPLINRFLAGYEQGLMLMNSGVDLTVTYTPNASNPFGDVASGRRVGERLYAEGNDIVYTAAGASGYGVIQSTDDFSDVYAIGVDQDQDYLNPGKVLCSMIKRVDSAVFNAIEGIIQDTWTPGYSNLGLVENGLDISPMTYTTEIKTGYFSYKGINQTRWDWITDIIQNISDGTIIV
ncbi:MAG: BMP family lipoprotein, partial [Candidatus Hodarchaeales archaeon]